MGQALLVFGGFYLLAMMTRYALRMALYSQERWTGGSIPTFFHWVLAGFLLIVGTYHGRGLSGQERARVGSLLPVVALLAAAAFAVLVGSRMAHLPPPGLG